jgi:uncharacterized protein YutE (UPF0331/DUF86 family)
MYNKEKVGRITKIIVDIEKYLSQIESYEINDLEDLSSHLKYNAASMALFSILNKLSDLGSEILFAEDLGAPSRYEDIMPALASAGIINKGQSDSLNELISKRNVLAHFYDDITSQNLLKLLKKLNIVREFLITVKKKVKVSLTGK